MLGNTLLDGCSGASITGPERIDDRNSVYLGILYLLISCASMGGVC